MADVAFGLVGCGQLGGAVGRAILRSGLVAPDEMWIANRSGPDPGFAAYASLHWTASLQELADHCPVILLALPPAVARLLRFSAANSLVVSVMAGINVETLMAISGSRRVVRGMSNPAAENAMAYSPWFAAPAVSDQDRALVRGLFGACGVTDEVPAEDQIDCFTAVTGPVPGFVAFFADSMARYAEARGIEPDIAQRAVKQLFRAAGHMLAASDETAAAHVQAMVDYAGTTAAGLNALRANGTAGLIADGLEMARLRALTIGTS